MKHLLKIKNYLVARVGYLIFALVGWLIVEIILSKESPFEGFMNINDTFASIIFTFGFLFSFIIYLANRKKISSKNYMSIIEKIPDFLPFKHTLKQYLLKFIRKDYKIIVLIRTLNEKNYKWVLNQIAAYNSMMNTPHLKLKENLDIEFLFVNNNTTEVETLIAQLNTEHYHYIVITSLSSIFKDTIMAREKLEEEEKESIQIIGALSSIDDDDIQHIIDNDDKIIRIFPPDYDEAKTAIEFIFSKIKNSICPNAECTLHHRQNNVIILHNGTYGRTVKDKCHQFFDEEVLKLNLNTLNELSSKELRELVNFYSFDLKSTGKFTYDQMEGTTLKPFFSQWKNANNYFYIIGYEPNISTILNYIDKAIDPYPNIRFALLFPGTASMKIWRESILNTLKESKNLKDAIKDCSYYLQLRTLKGIEESIAPISKFNLSLKQYSTNRYVDIKEVMMKLFPHKHEYEIQNILDKFWSSENNENNYISIFTIDSINIAKYTIENDTSLLDSKSQVLKKRKTDILVNGDSINQYAVNYLV